MIRAVVFDVGECLVDETREYGTWADWLRRAPAHLRTRCSARSSRRGATTARCSRSSGPASTCTRNASSVPPPGRPETFGEDRPVRRRSPRAGAAARGRACGWASRGTRPSGRARSCGSLFTDDVDLIGTSDDWGASKPDLAFFFGAWPRSSPSSNDEILYVGRPCRQRPAAGGGRGDAHRAGPPRSVGDDPVADRGGRKASRRSGSRACSELPELIAEVQRRSALTVVDQPYSRSSSSRTHRSCWCGASAAPHLPDPVHARRVPGTLQLVEGRQRVRARFLRSPAAASTAARSPRMTVRCFSSPGPSVVQNAEQRCRGPAGRWPAFNWVLPLNAASRDRAEPVQPLRACCVRTPAARRPRRARSGAVRCGCCRTGSRTRLRRHPATPATRPRRGHGAHRCGQRPCARQRRHGALPSRG